MKKVAVILSGCGHKDGSEIREAVLSLLYIEKNGAAHECFAPNIQFTAINHIDESAQGTRNVMEEAARISRGEIKDLTYLKAEHFDALILPGGYGAAKNLSDLALKGEAATVLPEYIRIVTDFHKARKPIGAICISPAVLVAALGRGKVTIGNDIGTAKAIVALGGHHYERETHQICTDEVNRIVSTPAYMYDDTLLTVSEGIEKLVAKVLELA